MAKIKDNLVVDGTVSVVGGLSTEFLKADGSKDPNNYTTASAMTTALALKANIDSPAFTGTPTLPTGTTGVTQTASTNNTTLATTAFVKSQTPSQSTIVDDATVSIERQIIVKWCYVAVSATYIGTAITPDGTAVVVGDLVLVTHPTAHANQGVWVVQSGAWTRATEMDTAIEMTDRIVKVTSGTLYANTFWTMVSKGAVTHGSTPVKFGQVFNDFSNEFAISTSGAVSLATSGTAGTYKSVTVNNKGVVTAGTNPTDLAGYGITNAYTKTESDARYAALSGVSVLSSASATSMSINLSVNQALNITSALTAATNITLSNPVVGVRNFIVGVQFTTAVAITLTMAGVSFYQDGTTLGNVGSIALPAISFLNSGRFEIEIDWVTATMCYVSVKGIDASLKANVASPTFTGTAYAPVFQGGVNQAGDSYGLRSYNNLGAAHILSQTDSYAGWICQAVAGQRRFSYEITPAASFAFGINDTISPYTNKNIYTATRTSFNFDVVPGSSVAASSTNHLMRKGEVDAALALKADSATTYTKTEVDNQTVTRVNNGTTETWGMGVNIGGQTGSLAGINWYRGGAQARSMGVYTYNDAGASVESGGFTNSGIYELGQQLSDKYQSALSLPFSYRGSTGAKTNPASSAPDTADYANLVGNGVWNAPYTGASALLIQFSDEVGSARRLQFSKVYGNSPLRYRNITDGTSPQPWRTVWDTLNFDPSIYLPLSGGVMSGSINMMSGIDIKYGTVAGGDYIGQYYDAASDELLFYNGTGGTNLFTLNRISQNATMLGGLSSAFVSAPGTSQVGGVKFKSTNEITATGNDIYFNYDDAAGGVSVTAKSLYIVDGKKSSPFISFDGPTRTMSTLNAPIVPGVKTASGTGTKVFADNGTTVLLSNYALASHNQAWSTITSTPTTLAGYGITNGFPSSSAVQTPVDLNTLTTVGNYHFDGVMTGLNFPYTSGNFRVLVMGLQNRCTQVAFDWNTDNMYFRRQIDGAVWQPWRAVMTDNVTYTKTQSDATYIKYGDSANGISTADAALDSYVTRGQYFVVNSTATPTTGWYYLEVYPHNTATSFCRQDITELEGVSGQAKKFYRTKWNNAWQPWVQIATGSGFLPLTGGSVSGPILYSPTAVKAQAIYNHVGANYMGFGPGSTVSNAADFKLQECDVNGNFLTNWGNLTLGSLAASNGGQALSLYPGATNDHCYMAFYARSSAPTTRSAYIGFAGAAATDMTFSNTLGNFVFDKSIMHNTSGAFQMLNPNNTGAFQATHSTYKRGTGAGAYWMSTTFGDGSNGVNSFAWRHNTFGDVLTLQNNGNATLAGVLSVSGGNSTQWNAKQAALNGTGLVRMAGTTVSYDNTTYVTSGDARLSDARNPIGLTVNKAGAANGAPDTTTQNQIGYTTGVSTSLITEGDGALYTSAHSVDWQHQILGNFRNGETFVRGKNNTTWQPWRKLWDSGNLNPNDYVKTTYYNCVPSQVLTVGTGYYFMRMDENYSRLVEFEFLLSGVRCGSAIVVIQDSAVCSPSAPGGTGCYILSKAFDVIQNDIFDFIYNGEGSSNYSVGIKIRDTATSDKSSQPVTVNLKFISGGGAADILPVYTQGVSSVIPHIFDISSAKIDGGLTIKSIGNNANTVITTGKYTADPGATNMPEQLGGMGTSAYYWYLEVVAHDNTSWCTQTATLFGGSNTISTPTQTWMDGFKYQRQLLWTGNATAWTLWQPINLSTVWERCGNDSFYGKINVSGMVVFKAIAVYGTYTAAGNSFGVTLLQHLCPKIDTTIPVCVNGNMAYILVTAAGQMYAKSFGADVSGYTQLQTLTWTSRALNNSF